MSFDIRKKKKMKGKVEERGKSSKKVLLQTAVVGT